MHLANFTRAIRATLLSLALGCALVLSAQTIPPFEVATNEAPSSGYYMLIPIRVGPGSATYSPVHLILDGAGEVVYYKVFPPGMNTSDLKLQPNGLISYTFMNKFYLMDSTFTVVDSVRCKNGIIHDGHDMQVLSDGHFLLLGWENVTMDLSGYPLFNNNGMPGSATASVRCGVIQEQDADKNVVFTWRARDHFVFDDVDPAWLTDPENVDWTHFNAIDEDSDGNILLSIRHFNEVTKIDRTTGDVIWRLGGNAGEYTFLNDPEAFKAQHDIRRLPSGNVTLLDNGSSGPPFHPVAAKEYQLDEVDHTASLVWSHSPAPDVFSGAIGSVLRMSNGNTVIDYGVTQGLYSAFEVVDPSGNTVLDLQFTDSLRSYRVFHRADWPWSFQRPVITCAEVDGQYYLDAGSGHASYEWSNGETTQVIPVLGTGDYSVFVPRGDGGFIRSEPFHVEELLDPCGTLQSTIGGPGHEGSTHLLSDVGAILAQWGPNVKLEVITVLGASMHSGHVDEGVLRTLAPGLYYIRVSSSVHKGLFRFVVP